MIIISSQINIFIILGIFNWWSSLFISLKKVASSSSVKKKLKKMTRTKNVCTNYIKICNIGYIQYSKGIAYKCLQQNCRFQSYDVEVFKNHLVSYHSIEGRTGYCWTCERFIVADTLIEEMDHLIEHLYFSNYCTSTNNHN